MTPTTTWSASGGSLRSAGASGAKLTVKFTGTYLAWVAMTAPWYGKPSVTLDGATAPVDLYSATVGWKKQVYNTGLLTDTTHILVIEYTGTSISVDAFDVLGVLDDPAP